MCNFPGWGYASRAAGKWKSGTRRVPRGELYTSSLCVCLSSQPSFLAFQRKLEEQSGGKKRRVLTQSAAAL